METGLPECRIQEQFESLCVSGKPIVFLENRAQLPFVGKLRTLQVEGRKTRGRQGSRHMGMAHSESTERNKTILHLKGKKKKKLERIQGDKWVSKIRWAHN